MFVLSAAIVAMGAIPKIFETNQTVNQTNFLLEQRIALTEQQEHEDKQRAQYEIKAEARQEKLLLENEQSNKEIIGNITKLITDGEKRSNISNKQRADTLNQTKEILLNLDQKSRDHEMFSRNMSELQVNLSNLSNQIRDMLHEYGENSVEKLQKIIDNQNKLGELINRTK